MTGRLGILMFAMISLGVVSCEKPPRDAEYTYTCTTTCVLNPFTIITKDTVFYNMTDAEAHWYARASSINGCTTDCER